MSNTAPEQQDTAFLWVENKGNNDGAVRKQIRQHAMHNSFRQKRSRAIGRLSVTGPLQWSWKAPVLTTAPEHPSEAMVLNVLSHEGRARLKELREQKLPLEGVLDSEDAVNEDIDHEETQNSSCSNELTVAHLDATASSSRSMTQSRMLPWPEKSYSIALAQRPTKRASPVPNNSTVQAVLGILTQPEVLTGNRFDPFHSLPARCTREDQLALQCIFDVLPETLYGVRRDAEWEPVRSMLFPRARDHVAMYLLFLLSAATFYIRAGGTLSPSYTARRRSQAYRLINEGLSDPAQRTSDGVFQSVMTALIVEARHQNMGASRVHLSGLLFLLKQRGGRMSLFGKPFHVTTLHGLHLAGRALDIISSPEDIQELHRQVDELVKTLEELQAWNTTLRLLRKTYIPRRQPAPAQHTFPAKALQTASPDIDTQHRRLSTIPPTPTPTQITTYLRTHHHAFSPPSRLHTILSTFHSTHPSPTSDLTYPSHCFLASLLSISLALLSHRHSPTAATSYLQTLVAKLRANCGPTANTQTLHLHLLQDGLDSDGDGGQIEFERKWRVLDGVRVLGRVSAETRREVVEGLFGWLMGGGEKEEGWEMGLLGRVRVEALVGV